MSISDDYYCKIFERVKKVFSSATHYVKVKEDGEDYYIKVDLYLNGTRFKLKVYIPEFFPSVLPRVYLDTHEEISRDIPHIDEKGFLCTFDSNEIVNEREPANLIIATIQRAKEILRLSFNSEYRQKEFTREFTRYWQIDSEENFTIYLLCDLDKDYEELSLVYICVDNKYKGFIVRDEEQKKIAEQFLDNFCSQTILMRVFVVKVSEKINPYAKCIKDVYAFNTEKKFLKEKFFDDANYLFIYYFKINEYKVVFGWIPELKNIVKGFRKNKIPLSVVLKKNNENGIKKIHIDSISKERLFGRIGNTSCNDEHIAVWGCGSLGSYTLRTLVDVGYSHFDLIDNECLGVENIARHLCGFDYIGINKADALKKYFNQSKPYIKIQAFSEHALDCINGLNKNISLHIIAIGNYNIEKRIDENLKGNKLFLWTEPYSLACHALFIPENSSYNFADFFDENYRFKYSVVNNNVLLEESGCGTTFMPYNINNFNNFISFLSYDITKIIKKTHIEATLFSGLYLRFYEEIKSLVTNGVSIDINPKFSEMPNPYLVKKI